MGESKTQDVREMATRRDRRKDVMACVTVASTAWVEAPAQYHHIPGTDKMLRIRPLIVLQSCIDNG